MTIDKKHEYFIGRDLWYEYVRVNGYAFYPKPEGLRKLAKLLDLKTCYVRKHIHDYLES